MTRKRMWIIILLLVVCNLFIDLIRFLVGDPGLNTVNEETFYTSGMILTGIVLTIWWKQE